MVPQIVKTYVETWSARNVDAWLATFAPDGTYSDPNPPKPTLAHGLREHFARFFAGFPDATCETVGLHAISNDVWTWRFIIRGTNTGSLRGIRPTGRKVEVPGCEFIEIGGDHVCRVNGYVDRLTMVNQLGLAPSSPARAET
jgi:predicted ester cyclase